jgi:hypothetical protein
MNKSGYQPLPVLLRAEPSDARWSSNSAKILRVVAILGTIFALCGAIVICLIAFNAFPTGKQTVESKAAVQVPSLPETTVSPADANQVNGASTLSPETSQAHPGTNADDHAIIDQMTTPAPNPASVPAPMATPEATVSDKDLLNGDRPDAARVNPERHLTEAVRKKLEKRRVRAELKRSRLEEEYQQHAISSEAYKKGEEKYRSEIERYHREMNAPAEPKN